MTAVTLDPTSIEEATGCTFISDVTGLTGATANRTIVFGIATGQFIAQFPVGTDQTSPFVDLFTHVLALALKCKIVADPVIIA